MQLDRAVCEAFAGTQLQREAAVTASNEWDAVRDEDWSHDEGRHSMEAFGLGASGQPAEIVISTRDITVGAGADVHDDLAAGLS